MHKTTNENQFFNRIRESIGTINLFFLNNLQKYSVIQVDIQYCLIVFRKSDSTFLLSKSTDSVAIVLMAACLLHHSYKVQSNQFQPYLLNLISTTFIQFDRNIS